MVPPEQSHHFTLYSSAEQTELSTFERKLKEKALKQVTETLAHLNIEIKAFEYEHSYQLERLIAHTKALELKRLTLLQNLYGTQWSAYCY